MPKPAAARKSKYRRGLTLREQEALGTMMFLESDAGRKYLKERELENASKEAQAKEKERAKKSAIELKARLLAPKRTRTVSEEAVKESIRNFLSRVSKRGPGDGALSYDAKSVNKVIQIYPQAMREIRAENPRLFKAAVKALEHKRSMKARRRRMAWS
jgi:hypothetical protein